MPQSAVNGAGRSPLTRGSLWRAPMAPRAWRSIPAHAGEPLKHDPFHPDLRVDPRSRGGADIVPDNHSLAVGRSPLTRGSRSGPRVGDGSSRSIPAHAGEPSASRSSGFLPKVDPRSRGGASALVGAVSSAWGRSPLTRGSQGEPAPPPEPPGSIPAHAGEPLALESRLSYR